MAINKIATLLLLGTLTAAGIAKAQDPPPYPGGDSAAPPPADQANPAPPPPDAGAAADPAAAGIDYFHGQLSPYGQWVIRPGYGEVWVPNVTVGWRPYTTGHWIYTDQGWAWAADEPWGWAPFHYGRWYYDAQIGWGWVPGYTWAPAWVAWRHGGGYLGWAALPPSVGFRVGVGLAFGSVTIGTGYYTFCGERDILAPHIGGFIVPSSRNVTFINNTTNITNYTVVNNRIVNVGIPGAQVAQVVGHPVQPVAVASLTSAGAGGRGAFYQPAIIARAARATPNEFGHALTAQVAVQQHSSSWAALKSTPAGAGRLTARSATATAPGGTHPGATHLGGSHPAGSTGTGSSTGNTHHRSTGAGAGTVPHSIPGAGSPNTSKSTGTSQGTSSTGHGSTASSTGSTGATGSNRSTRAGTPPPQGAKSSPPPPGKGQSSASEKGHKPPPAA